MYRPSQRFFLYYQPRNSLHAKLHATNVGEEPLEMRHSISFAFVSLFTVTGCSTYSATNVVAGSRDAGPDAVETGGSAGTGGAANGGSSTAGTKNTGGSTNTGEANIGGASSQAGTSSMGGTSASAGGVTSTGGTATSVGGMSSTGGASSFGGKSSTGGSAASPGGTSSIGGASSSGGTNSTGGSSPCTKDADCINLDPTNCSYTCVNPGTAGLCKPTATLTPTQCATSACEDEAISGFWDASGKPHIAYAWTESDGSATIRMQQVKADGAVVAIRCHLDNRRRYCSP